MPLSFISLPNIEGSNGKVLNGIASVSCSNICAPIENGSTVLPIPAETNIEHASVFLKDNDEYVYGILTEASTGNYGIFNISSIAPCAKDEIIEFPEPVFVIHSKAVLMDRIVNYLTVKKENLEPGDKFINALLTKYQEQIETVKNGVLDKIKESTMLWKSGMVTFYINEKKKIESDPANSLENLLITLAQNDLEPFQNLINNSENIEFLLSESEVN